MSTARYLWRHPVGRFALLALLVGIIGLTLHYWAPVLLVGAIPYGALRARAGVTAGRPDPSHTEPPFRSSDDAE